MNAIRFPLNRREFLRDCTGAFALAAGGSLFGAAAPSARVRVALVGCHAKGRGFQLLLRTLETPGAEIAVVCDVDSRAREAALAAVRERTGKAPAAVGDFREILGRKDVDAVMIATPDHWHAWMAVAAMRAGKHVYVEKPCCFCPAEGELIVKVQKETGRVFTMGSQRRSGKSYVEAVKSIRAGEIGEVKFARAWYQNNRKSIGRGKVVPPPEWLDWELWQGPAPRERYRDNLLHYNWHWTRKWGTGECGNNATHLVDLVRWALDADYPVRTVSAGANAYKTGDDWEWCDVQNVTWEFPGGKTVVWEGHSSACYPPPFNDWTGCHLIGDKGSVFLGASNCALFDADGRKVRSWTPAGDEKEALSLTNPCDQIDRDHIADFVRCVRDGDVNTAQGAESSYKSSLLPLLANMAQTTGEAVRTDPRTGRLLAGSPGERFWSREYEKGWELK